VSLPKRLIQTPIGFILIIIGLSLAIRWPLAIATYGTEDITSWHTVAEAAPVLMLHLYFAQRRSLARNGRRAALVYALNPIAV
jgi:hypothetical protein